MLPISKRPPSRMNSLMRNPSARKSIKKMFYGIKLKSSQNIPRCICAAEVVMWLDTKRETPISNSISYMLDIWYVFIFISLCF